MSDSLQPLGLQLARVPRVCSNSCLLSWWCHPAISSSVTHFSSYPQSFPASGSFPMSWLLLAAANVVMKSSRLLMLRRLKCDRAQISSVSPLLYWFPFITLVGLIMAPKHVHILILRTCECFLVWLKGFWRCD